MKNYYFLSAMLLAGAAFTPAFAQDTPAPIDELVMASSPCMSFEGTVNLEEFPLGMSQVMLNCMVTVEVNTECNEPIVLNWLVGDEPTMWGSISATNAADLENPTAPGYLITSYSAGLDEADMGCGIVLLFHDDMAITGEGYYDIEIPDGFFKYNGEEVPGGALIFEIAGAGYVEGPESFAEAIYMSSPEMDKACNIEMWDVGVAGMFFMMDPEAGVMSVNKKCPYNIKLMKGNGEVLSEISATADETIEVSPEFKPAYTLNSISYGEEGLTETQLSLRFFEEFQYEPGTYILSVPDDFFMIGEGENAYPLYGNNFMIVLADENNQVGSFESFVYNFSPMPDTKINVETDPRYVYFGGIDGLEYNLNPTLDICTNPESAPVKVTKDGADYVEAGAIPDFSGTKSYVDSYENSVMSEGSDSEFGGFGDDPGFTVDPAEVPVVNNWTVAIVFANDAFIKEPGTYTVTIPTGFFRLGEFDMTESVFNYIVINNSVAVEMFKSEKAVTVFNVNGVRVLDNAPVESLRNLAKGIYVINGKKVVMN